MGIDRQCQWVRHRLPLLIGGELKVDERRRVERHLIGCLDCRGSRESSSTAFSALRSMAEVSPARADAPSLWPALSAQIRQSRHASPTLSWWEVPGPRAWTVFGMAMLSGRAEPVRSSEATVTSRPVELPKLASRPPVASLPNRSSRPDALPKNPGNVAFDPTSPSAIPLTYDLDHGTLVTPGDRDPQHSY
jgi:anti-sigma factor RsiW